MEPTLRSVAGERNEGLRGRGQLRFFSLPIGLAVTLLTVGGTAPAQDFAAESTPKLNTVLDLRAFEPAADAPYELGAGDEIAIDVAGRPELSGKRVIGPDGRITLPLAGSLTLLDKTRDEASQVILSALSPFYEGLSVTVGVDRYSANRVLLLGDVRSPGVIAFDGPPTLLEVLTRGNGLRYPTTSDASGLAGGVDSSGNPSRARASVVVPERCAIYRGSNMVLWVDLKGLLDKGSGLADLRLKRGDVVYVPSPIQRYVSILGRVAHPGAFELDNNTTLTKLIAEAGGLSDFAGGNPKIQIVQPATGAVRTIEYKTLLEPTVLDLTLRSGDVVYVPESGFNKVAYVLDRLSPLVTLFTVASVLKR